MKNKGVALITVMLVVALAAILATQMLARLQLQLQRTTNINYNQQAYWYALGAEAFAQRVLLKAIEDEPDVTKLSQDWAQGETSYPVDFGQITGEIIDLQACLNLNALRVEKESNDPGTVKNPARDALKLLIADLSVEGIGEYEAAEMADALVDWLDADSSIVSPQGAEDNDYASKEFAYLPPNNFIAGLSELRLVEHFTLPVIEALKPYVCVLPNTERHEININTLTSEQSALLAALLDITQADAEQLISAREEDGYDKIEDFFATPEFGKLSVNDDLKKQLVVDSEYFKLKSSASFNDSFFAMSSVFKVEDNKKVHVVSRKIGKE